MQVRRRIRKGTASRRDAFAFCFRLFPHLSGQMSFAFLRGAYDALHQSGEHLRTRSELALASSFRLLLALHGRLLIVLTLTDLSDHAVLCTGALEALECSVQRLGLTNAYFCHEFFPSLCPSTEAIYSRVPSCGGLRIAKLFALILYHRIRFLSSKFCKCCVNHFAFVSLLQNSPACFVYKSACGGSFRRSPPAPSRRQAPSG